MTPNQKLDLIEAQPVQPARHWIPSGRIRFVVDSAEQHWLVRLERSLDKLRNFYGTMLRKEL